MYEESIQEMDFDMDEQKDLVIDCESESDEISPEAEISTTQQPQENELKGVKAQQDFSSTISNSSMTLYKAKMTTLILEKAFDTPLVLAY